MTPASKSRDVESSDEAAVPEAGEGRLCIAVIGIDRYRSWGQLQNAVNDAQGAQAAFQKLGFEPICEPLLDEAATRDALHQLVNDDLAGKLREQDSLVLFFAGHGHSVPSPHAQGPRIGTGYLIPVDADPHGGRISTWLHLGSWLSAVARLPPRHILVILDACHSGIALDPVMRWRGESVRFSEALEAISARRSRRVFASALDDQLAMDGGPFPGHSLFTGCLIDALSGGFLHRKGQSPAIGMEIWTDVKSRVINYPDSRQSPEFAALEYHEHGDFIIDLRRPRRRKHSEPDTRKPVRWTPAPVQLGRPVHSHIGSAYHPSLGPRKQGLRPGAGSAAAPKLARTRGGGAAARVHESRPGAPFVAALDRQESERSRGVAVLTVIPADSMSSLAGFAAWAAGRGYLTLVIDGAGIDEAIAALLSQMPWLRCLAMARRSLAAAAQLDLDAVEAELDARAGEERRAWIDNQAGLDPQVRVSGWLLSVIREPSVRALDPATAPVHGGALLSALCELAAPVAVLVHHATPTAPWLERALAVASGLVGYLPGHPVAVGAPDELVARVLGGKRQSASITMGRQGLIPAAPRRPPAVEGSRDRTAQALHAALSQDVRTAGIFERGARVPVHDGGPDIEVDLAAEDARLAVVIDGWYQRSEPQGYQRDREDDARLGRSGYFIMRFAAEDIGARIAFVVNEIAIGLAGRRASEFFGGPLW
jgi:hypothetical protein